jgi:hypothetical protein
MVGPPNIRPTKSKYQITQEICLKLGLDDQLPSNRKHGTIANTC